MNPAFSNPVKTNREAAERSAVTKFSHWDSEAGPSQRRRIPTCSGFPVGCLQEQHYTGFIATRMKQGPQIWTLDSSETLTPSQVRPSSRIYTAEGRYPSKNCVIRMLCHVWPPKLTWKVELACGYFLAEFPWVCTDIFGSEVHSLRLSPWLLRALKSL